MSDWFKNTHKSYKPKKTVLNGGVVAVRVDDDLREWLSTEISKSGLSTNAALNAMLRTVMKEKTK